MLRVKTINQRKEGSVLSFDKQLIEVIFFVVLIYALSAFFAWSVDPSNWPLWLRGVDAVVIFMLFALYSYVSESSK